MFYSFYRRGFVGQFRVLPGRMLAFGDESRDDCRKDGRVEPVAMRLEVKEGRSGCTLINDSYNSDYNSLDIALDFMNRRPDCAGRKRTLILSDIEQAGGAPEDLYGRVPVWWLCAVWRSS